MKENFANCLAVTLVEEGGWSNNPHDPGGATMKGVTQSVYNVYRKAHDKPIQSVRNITAGELEDIYSAEYWVPAGCNALPAGLDMMVFDTAVNSGVGEANRLRTGLPKVGSTGALVIAYGNARLGFMHRLRTWRFFDRGWTARVKYVQSKALEMVK